MEKTTVCRAGVASLALLLSLTGCSTAEDGARETAGEFYAAVVASDGGTACSLLAPRTVHELEKSAGKHCAQAVVEALAGIGTGTSQVRAYGEEAQVRMGGETGFLALFPSGWKVVAAGCRPRDDGPYDCTVQGG